jgi:hypothetical protein
VYYLPTGTVQWYVRDPSGNLIEINYPDVEDIDQSVVQNIVERGDVEARDGPAAGADGFDVDHRYVDRVATDIRVGRSLDLTAADPSHLSFVTKYLEHIDRVVVSHETYGDALRVGRACDEQGFFWYEDPLSETGESIYIQSRLADELKTSILGCEHARTGPFGRADHIVDKAVDMVRADAHLDGGITALMKIAHLAESFGLDVEIHLGGHAHLHCMSAIRNTNYYEHGLLHPQFEWRAGKGLQKNVDQVDSDGMVEVPDGPGLGFEVDWEYIEEHQLDRTTFTAGS